MKTQWYISSRISDNVWHMTEGWVDWEHCDMAVFDSPAKALDVIRDKDLLLVATIYPHATVTDADIVGEVDATLSSLG